MKIFLKTKKHPLSDDGGCRTQNLELVDNERFDFFQELVAVVAVDFCFDGFGKIQAENAHDGFCVDCVSAGDEIHIEVILRDDVDKVLDVVDSAQENVDCFHNFQPPKSNHASVFVRRSEPDDH